MKYILIKLKNKASATSTYRLLTEFFNSTHELVTVKVRNVGNNTA